MRSTRSLLCFECIKKALPKIRIWLMLCVVFEVPPNIIGSQRKKLIVQKPNVALNINRMWRLI